MGRRKLREFEERARRKQRDEQIRAQYKAVGDRPLKVDPSRLMAGLSDDLHQLTAVWRDAIPDIAGNAAVRGAAVSAARLGIQTAVSSLPNPDVVALGRKALTPIPIEAMTTLGRLFAGGQTPDTDVLRAGLDAVLGGAGGVASMAVNSTEGVCFSAGCADVFQEQRSDWQWIARCGSTTCAFCWAMHGQVFGPDQTLDSHPNCACEMRPVNGGTLTPGVDRFAAAPVNVQRSVLGPVAHAAYRAGEIQLTDLVAHKQHPVLGRVGGTASLTSVLGADRVNALRSKILYGR